MSRYLPKLHSRDGIKWKQPGEWQQESITRLSDFAVKLEVTQSATQTDMLNSVPVPWARLLMFETALFNSGHPAHAEIVEQWRGLLGLIALGGQLGVILQPYTVSLLDFEKKHPIARTFLDLSPGYAASAKVGESDKWESWQLLLADGEVIGATSPRTLIFTGVSHHCPDSIPFRSSAGRLTDPAKYFRKFNDTETLSLLGYWIDSLIQRLHDDPQTQNWLGALPVALGGTSIKRSDQLLTQLSNWRGEIGGTSATAPGVPLPVFNLSPYKQTLTALPAIPESRSDFFLAASNNLLIFYSPHAPISSCICNANGMVLMGEPLRVFGRHWVLANDEITVSKSVIPPRFKVIKDPASLFEDSLLKVDLPEKELVADALRVGGESYLFPFKAQILDYYSPGEIVRNTKTREIPERNAIEVTLELPLRNQRFIRVAREYRRDTEVFSDGLLTPNMAVWPDFAAADWQRYFYYIKKLGDDNYIEFTPLKVETSNRRIESTRTEWLESRQPIEAFIGRSTHKDSFDKQGLLLLHYRPVDPPRKFWKVGVDFGSTHTRVFSLEVKKPDPSSGNLEGDAPANLEGVATAKIEPVVFLPRTRAITRCDRGELKINFFAENEAGYAQKSVYKMDRLSSLLYQPQLNPGELADWLPREGFVFQQSLLEVAPEYRQSEHLRRHLKWDNQDGSHALRAFFRGLMLMTQAEAFDASARIIETVHTHPSVLPKNLRTRQKNEWSGVQLFLNTSLSGDQTQLRIVSAGITETVAVCRHLADEQGASTFQNVISLDVGGSTTDLAVWARNKLFVNESVKAAAGVVANFINAETPRAEAFRQKLFGVLAGEPYRIPAGGKPYDLMFYEALSTAESNQLLGQLIDSIQAAEEKENTAGLITHLTYLFSMLLYYAGLLARKAELQSTQSEFYVYFSGKGGQLVTWIPAYKEMVEWMFLAGLRGPNATVTGEPPSVQVKLSSYSKQEVGRGLLADSRLEGQERKIYFGEGMAKPAVTFGENGYHNLQWNAELNEDSMKQLKDLPPLAKLHELKHFLQAMHANPATRRAAKMLDLPDPALGDYEPRMRKFNAALGNRLFGMQRGAIVYDLIHHPDDAVNESLLITELKVLLETLTENSRIFAEGQLRRG